VGFDETFLRCRGSSVMSGGGEALSDVDSFDAFYTATRKRMLRYALALTGDANDAQDVAQEAYARAWQHWTRVRRSDDPEAWVRTVAWRIAANRWRGLASRTRLLARLGPPAVVPEPSSDTVSLVAALQQIPLAQRRAIVLHYVFGLSVGEVAMETDAPVGTVKTRLARGRESLGPLLAEGSDVASDSAGTDGRGDRAMSGGHNG
jgi:RNA polymerase sigma-70 factor, ECF subfamily